MKHIIRKIFSLLKSIFFFFRVHVTLELGKSDEKDGASGDEDHRKEIENDD